jgi:hypothetical protein
MKVNSITQERGCHYLKVLVCGHRPVACAIHQGRTNFQKILEPPQKVQASEGSNEASSTLRTQKLRLYSTKFNRYGDLASGICALLLCTKPTARLFSILFIEEVVRFH